MDNLKYRKSLIEKLISNYHSDQDLRKQGRPPKKPGSLRLTERHFPEIIPPTDKKQAPTRQCAVCCKSDEKGKKIRRESRYYCDPCKVGLCAAPCFRIFHTKENFWLFFHTMLHNINFQSHFGPEMAFIWGYICWVNKIHW